MQGPRPRLYVGFLLFFFFFFFFFREREREREGVSLRRPPPTTRD